MPIYIWLPLAVLAGAGLFVTDCYGVLAFVDKRVKQRRLRELLAGAALGASALAALGAYVYASSYLFTHNLHGGGSIQGLPAQVLSGIFLPALCATGVMTMSMIFYTLVCSFIFKTDP